MILDESGYTEMWQNDKSPEAQGRLENLKELVRSMGEFENLAGFLEHIALVMDREQQPSRRQGQHHDAARRQGPGIRHGVPARLGGRPVPAPARAGREGPRRPGGRAPPRLCRHHPGQAPRHHFLRPEPPHPQPLAERPALALHRRTAGGPCRGGPHGNSYRRLRPRQLRRRAASTTAKPFTNTYATPGWQRAQERWSKGEGLRSTPNFIEGEMVARDTRQPRRFSKGSASSTRNSATAASPPSTATSSPSTSTRPAKSACSTAS